MARLAKFRVLRLTDEGWTQAIDADGDQVFQVGLDPARSRAGAEELAQQMADAEIGAQFCVVDDSGAELFRALPALAEAPF